uniref:Replication-associated protein n=1 Tax=Cressdnaviricota sp. TaxID=2748378 RepID=A0A4D6J1U9_9VIRU|nr:replication-associated protein [Cressdnaviricota sp.]
MSRCKWVDATAWAPVGAPDWSVVCTGLMNDKTMKIEDWKHELDGYFERYAFGCEIAPETKRRHFQFRGVLKVDLDANTNIALSGLGLRHVTPTKVRDFEYVYKDHNFFCSWEVFRPEYDKVMCSPYVWQVQLEDVERDERTIEIIVDEKGNSGKTAWAMYQDYAHRAVYIPPLKRGLDLVACVLGKRESDWYIIDTPRAFEFNDDWACSIEQLKNGYVFDTRYSFRDRYLSVRPRVTILCNHLPDYEKYFSADRVFPMKITPEGYLWSV